MKTNISKYICPVIVLLIFCMYAKAQSSSQNYIRTRTMTHESDATKYIETIQYYDGLGRPVETVQRGITPNQADLIAFQEYDGFGREDKAWLPAIASGNNGVFLNLTDFKVKSGNTYNNTTYNSVKDAEPYSYPVYESSPLNRINKQFGPGASWHTGGKSVNTDYLTNSSTYPCAWYYIEGNNLKRNNNYSDGQLYVTKTTDEDGNISYEFKDKLGRVVLQRQMDASNKHDTYYIYDDFGNLRYVLPPMAADVTTNGSYDENSTTIRNYAYVYKYDNRNRCIWKQLPGCQPVYYVYDKADRLIFSQDGQQRLSGKWLFTIPDALGRVVMTGMCSNTLAWNNNPLNGIVVKAEYSGGTNAFKGYTVSGISLSSPAILSVNYYDNYNFVNTNGISNIPFDTSAGADFNKQYASSSKGLLTGTLMAVLEGTAISSANLYSVKFYDYKGQLIQIISNNHLGGMEKEYFSYKFTGQVSKRKHVSVNSNPITEDYRYDYDHAGRLTDTYHRLNGQPEYLISRNTYDELGRLKTTMPCNLSAFKSNYSYNIRSWISQIGGSSYREDLTYKYNGDVVSMQWIQEGMTRAYSFSYDGLSRLREANYNSLGSDRFSAYYNYDKHGNIVNLVRYGMKMAGSYDVIDKLTLNYGGTNQLKNVYDDIPIVNISTSYDFKNYGGNWNTQYYYNSNGAITQDLNRGISNIIYNILNLPAVVDIKSPVAEARNQYMYSADGQKLKVERRWASGYSTNPVIGSDINVSSLNNIKTIDYSGNIIYENRTLKRILTDNGYFENGNYYFYVKNHLGSNVMAVRNDGYIVQNNHYYPFGLTMNISDNQGAQPYKYTGKELDMEHGLMQYDYEARQYDPAVGRFTTMDPLAEKYYSISPYAYCANNPVRYVDLHGDSLTLTGSNLQETLTAIYNGLADGTNISMKFNNGVLDPSSISEQAQNTSDLFLQDIYEIAVNPTMVELSISDKNTYMMNGRKVSEDFTVPSDVNTSEFGTQYEALLKSWGEPLGKSINGNLGQTLIPGNVSVSGKSSTNNNVQVIINGKGSLNHRTVGIAHEFGHVVLYLRGLPYGHGQPGVDDFIYKRSFLMSKKLGYDF